MSAAEDDTELRDLLIQNLENSGVLNKLKAEMRAAVFLAMEEQDKVENKSPLVNENLKNFLNTKDGRLVASLIIDFLQVYHLDFTLAVFQPEINLPIGLDNRDLVCRDLGLSDSETKSPLLLELIRRGRHKDRAATWTEGDGLGPISKELSPKQIANARKKFDLYDKDHSGSVIKEDLFGVFTDLFPTLNKNMLERFIADELRSVDKAFCKTVDFQIFLGFYKRLFAQCRSVVVQDSDVCQLSGIFDEEKISLLSNNKVAEYKGSNGSTSSLDKGDDHQGSKQSAASYVALNRVLDLDLEVEDDLDDGDSFFDDPLPKPQKIYGCHNFGESEASERRKSPKDVVPPREECLSGPVVSPMRRSTSLNDLSVLAVDSEDEHDNPLSEHSHSQNSGLRKVEASRDGPVGSAVTLQKPKGGGTGSPTSELSPSRNGTSNSREPSFKDTKATNNKTGSLLLDDDLEYKDDFNSHRSDLSKSELSINEEIEEVSIEGTDDSNKFDETTQDVSVSQLSQSHGADYMEEVA